MMLQYDHLKGLTFDHGKQDCYSIIRGFYKHNFGIELRDYARPDNWWNEGLNLYMDNFRKEGFEVVDIPLHQMQLADIMLMAIQTEQACHAGIYVGNGEMLHHFINRLSKVDPIRGLWKNACVAIVRHKDVKIAPDAIPTVDMMSLLLPHKRQLLEKALGRTS